MDKHLKYRSGYMNDRGVSCAGCREYMPFETLYLAVMLQSRKKDSKYAIHYHVRCFFKHQRLRTATDVAGFEKLRVKDQNDITKKIDKYIAAIIVQPKEKQNELKRQNMVIEPVKMSKAALRDYGIEYSRSGRAQCCGCRQKIPKHVVRCKKVVYDTEVGMNYGGQSLWHHFDCFVKLKISLGWYGSADQLPGFELLKEEDQQMVLQELSSVKMNEIPEVKKPKMSAKQVDEQNSLQTIRSKQNELFFYYRDMVKSKLLEFDWKKILERNKQQIPNNQDEILDLVADILAFGALLPCSVCNGQLVLDKFGYLCTGEFDEWTKCDNYQKEPKRRTTMIPKELKKMFPNYLGHTENRTFSTQDLPSTSTLQGLQHHQNHTFDVKVQRERPPLYQMEVATIGKTTRPRSELKEAIEKLGGKLITKIHNRLFAIISTENEVKKMSNRMKDASSAGIQIMTEEFVDKIQQSDCNAIEYIKENSICNWGTDPALRIPQDEIAGSKIKSIYTTSVPKSMTLKVVDGMVVDPKSGLQDHAKVYAEDSIKYSATLSRTDIQEDQNSYYKLQLLESNDRKKYWIFTAEGRIGTNIGQTNLESYRFISDARNQFLNLYTQKTGNRFGQQPFVKKPGKYIIIDIDYTEKDIKKITDRPNIQSKLPLAVQNLIKMIFDVDRMKKAMLEFDLDLQKMPLGKLSKHQLLEALNVLKKLSKFIEDGRENIWFVSASNNFYALIPHDFGIQRPPIIDTLEMVNAKTEMIDTLLQMIIAFNLLQADDDDATSPLDHHYNQLKTDIQTLEMDSEEYALIQTYLKNTHAKTHMYNLEIDEIFKINRAGEERQYEPFKKLNNRKLLWHGSRLTNFVGILSHGLKIAPPEAPTSGYMFGKGIYFADMVTKSANYCFSSTDGLLLLCEVALGNMLERTAAEYIVNLPTDKHSTKGLGQTYPHDKESHYLANGVEIPLGSSVTDLCAPSNLLYNEYIVYDAAQVNLKYLLKVKFKQRK